MVRLKSFSKVENAHTTAAFLRSLDIEATVVDESSFGGNALGATPNSIRIEVPEEQLAEAREALEEMDRTPIEEGDLEEDAESSE